jgi:hypothetical protein
MSFGEKFSWESQKKKEKRERTGKLAIKRVK